MRVFPIKMITFADAIETLPIYSLLYIEKRMIDSSAFQGKKAKYFTLGCKLNFSETSTFGKMLAEMAVNDAEGFAKLAETAKSKIA